MDAVIRNWLDLATTSPSGGNAQPWIVEYSEKPEEIRFRLTIDPIYKSKESPMDLDGSAATIALGSFGKTLEIAASLDHYSLKEKIINEGHEFWSSSVTYCFIKGPQSASPLYKKDSVLKRRTNREPYYIKEIPLSLKSKIKAISDRYPDIQYTEITNSDKDLVRSWEGLEKLRFRNKHLIRSIVEEVNISHKDKGLPITQLGVAPQDMLLLVLLKTFKFFYLVFKFGGYLIAIHKGVTVPITNAVMFGLISPLENTTKNLLSVGEFFQEYWITVNEEEASLHPMCNSLLLYNILCAAGPGIVNEREKSEASRIYVLMKDKFKVDLKKPTIGFRLGYARTVTDRSPRQRIVPILNDSI